MNIEDINTDEVKTVYGFSCIKQEHENNVLVTSLWDSWIVRFPYENREQFELWHRNKKGDKRKYHKEDMIFTDFLEVLDYVQGHDGFVSGGRGQLERIEQLFQRI